MPTCRAMPRAAMWMAWRIAYNCFGTVGALDFPYTRGCTAAHEIGHWLNLFHPWAPGNANGDCEDDDFVNDTPQTSEANYVCSFSVNSCNEGAGDLPDMVENYMDYASDQCQNIFTIGQKNRMRATLSAGGYRYSVAQNAGVIQPISQGANDAVLLSIMEPGGPGNCTDVSPIIRVRNFGTAPLIYMQIQYSVEGNTQSYLWTGEIAPVNSAEITLPPINVVTGSIVQNLTVTISTPNGFDDFSPGNNQLQSTFATISAGSGLAREFKRLKKAPSRRPTGPSKTRMGPLGLCNRRWRVAMAAANRFTSTTLATTRCRPPTM